MTFSQPWSSWVLKIAKDEKQHVQIIFGISCNLLTKNYTYKEKRSKVLRSYSSQWLKYYRSKKIFSQKICPIRFVQSNSSNSSKEFVYRTRPKKLSKKFVQKFVEAAAEALASFKSKTTRQQQGQKHMGLWVAQHSFSATKNCKDQKITHTVCPTILIKNDRRKQRFLNFSLNTAISGAPPSIHE